MRILLLVSAFNGLSQRVWLALRDLGHDVGVQLAGDGPDIITGVTAARPDLILCPYLTKRVPAEVWQRWPTVILHPGPVGDRGPSSLDWAISDGMARWGVTALQAVEEMDAGPVWATRTFAMPATATRKSALYAGLVADAALECALEVVEKASDPMFVATPAEKLPVEVPGARLRPAMRQADRSIDWAGPVEQILRRVRAADGVPGVLTEIAGLPVYAYDAHRGPVRKGRPGEVLLRREGAVLIAAGDGSVWLGHLRPVTADGRPGIKLPAVTVLGSLVHGVAHASAKSGRAPDTVSGYGQIRYRRDGAVGWLHFDFYNGAMAAGHCRRLLSGLRHAVEQDTRVVVLCSGTEAFSTGIHLNMIEHASDPAAEGWANIRAINEVCKEIITCTRQTVVAAYNGSAGAGGAMLGLGADVVAARDGIVLNPYYDIGLFGSELHTYTLPARVGADQARRLLSDKLPISADHASRIGLVDEVGPRHSGTFLEWLATLAAEEADPALVRARAEAKQRRLAASPPLGVFEARELAEMSFDLFDDRSGFAAARRMFVSKIGKPAPHLLAS
ncbi:putative two-component system hydrogenase maturation factor HypX/HoxX [Actinoplanes campanulatus]|uniref:Putative two-component system hydrogenase maturation factor HypX/HoxX n=1 Tax=Actinoplanes campanulatus TaxID=113559 RepID=A0A7W5AK38_9ACTN|nr:hydrogenase maturation protein [Actinoplanes campanulatus]MBB3097743.1 putative two-component system hydrogenase maturation factor HypX/HoxX [Actinoplanes campanulatus]GGN38117.1 formyl transferase [Actinoplanes campanulatus]GID39686.1 formyl transferase [Actinoplanes campanulatus]